MIDQKKVKLAVQNVVRSLIADTILIAQDNNMPVIVQAAMITEMEEMTTMALCLAFDAVQNDAKATSVTPSVN